MTRLALLLVLALGSTSCVYTMHCTLVSAIVPVPASLAAPELFKERNALAERSRLQSPCTMTPHRGH